MDILVMIGFGYLFAIILESEILGRVKTIFKDIYKHKPVKIFINILIIVLVVNVFHSIFWYVLKDSIESFINLLTILK